MPAPLTRVPQSAGALHPSSQAPAQRSPSAAAGPDPLSRSPLQEQRAGGLPSLLEGHEKDLVDKLVEARPSDAQIAPPPTARLSTLLLRSPSIISAALRFLSSLRLRPDAPCRSQTLDKPSCAVDLARRVDREALVNLITAACSAFLHNSLYESVKRFLSTAQGSFGLGVTCSLDVDRVALAAWNQPMSIGFAPTRNLVVYGSESNAVKVPLPGTRPDGSALDDGETAISHRLDIDNVDGEARFRLREKESSSLHTGPRSSTRCACALTFC